MKSPFTLIPSVRERELWPEQHAGFVVVPLGCNRTDVHQLGPLTATSAFPQSDDMAGAALSVDVVKSQAVQLGAIDVGRPDQRGNPDSGR